MSVWLVWEDDYNSQYVAGAFTTEAEAIGFAKGRRVEEQVVWEQAPAPWTYWHVGAEVYPDGIVKRWEIEHEGEGEVTFQPCDDHLNAGGRVWDGHTQGHCGEHVSIFGTDLRACVIAREARAEEALARQDGTCHGQHRTHKAPADGRTIYETGFMQLRNAGEEADRPWECPHEWEEWSEWRDVEGGRNRQRICKKCIRLEIAASFPVPATPQPQGANDG